MLFLFIKNMDPSTTEGGAEEKLIKSPVSTKQKPTSQIEIWL